MKQESKQLPETNAEMKRIAQARGLTPRGLAEALGMPLNSAKGYANNTVSRWWYGHRKLSPERLYYIKQVLGADHDA